MNWKKLLLSPDADIMTALSVIDTSGEAFALVVDDERHLLGVVTDGNIRRALLGGCDLYSSIRIVMNPDPVVAEQGISPEQALNMLQEQGVTHLPVIDAQKKLVEVYSTRRLLNLINLPNPVVLMVGGLGSRLGELTRDMPKPMLTVGDKPLLEVILKSFSEYGFRKFYFAVNYHAHIIEDFFGNGARHGVSIRYLREKKALGTVGALTLLPSAQITKGHPIIVMNGDILTRLNPRMLLEHHLSQASAATMLVRAHKMQIPYGVISRTEDGSVTDIQEKPEHSVLVSAGINIFSTESIALIPRNTSFDVPDLIHTLLTSGHRVDTYELDDYWLDIGRPSEYKKAKMEYAQIFVGEE